MQIILGGIRTSKRTCEISGDTCICAGDRESACTRSISEKPPGNPLQLRIRSSPAPASCRRRAVGENAHSKNHKGRPLSRTAFVSRQRESAAACLGTTPPRRREARTVDGTARARWKFLTGRATRPYGSGVKLTVSVSGAAGGGGATTSKLASPTRLLLVSVTFTAIVPVLPLPLGRKIVGVF